MAQITLNVKEKDTNIYNDCDDITTYSGNGIFPFIKSFDLSEEERQLKIAYSTTNNPIKLKVYLNEVLLFTSPYIGTFLKQSELDAFNIANNFPLETIQNVLTSDIVIAKTTTDRTLRIEVYAPLPGNGFNITRTCEI